MPRLEVFECDRPSGQDPCGFVEIKRRVVPAHWWLHAAVNGKWVTVCDLHWWQLWRLLRIRPRRYWPLRLRWRISDADTD